MKTIPARKHQLPVNYLNTSFNKYLNKSDTDLRVHPYLGFFLKKYFTLNEPASYISGEELHQLVYDHRNGQCQQICFLRMLNESRDINEDLKALFESLAPNGLLIGYAETAAHMKARILNKYPRFINAFVYLIFFLTHRVFPKLCGLTHRIYHFFPTKRMVLSKAEVMGRLFYSGLHIQEYQEDNGLLIFVAARKTRISQHVRPSYWPILKMRRIGKNNEPLHVYKLRTMHPYSEFIQEFIEKNHGLDEDGKFRNDFRVASWGLFLRRYWIDELPMIINLLKGEIKLIGLRPISYHYFSIYRKEIQLLRAKYKPGLIPSFYADRPKTLDKIMESERNYLLKFEKQPVRTDFTYAVKIFENIFLKRLRSK